MDWCSIVDGVLAQLGEHLPYKQRVTGSSPVGPIVTNVLCRCGSIGRAADEYKKYKARTLSDVEEDYPRINIFLGCYTEM